MKEVLANVLVTTPPIAAAQQQLTAMPVMNRLP